MNVTTTAGEYFSGHDHATLALMVYKRFGYDLESATAAWRRMLQNNATKSDFMSLLGQAAGSS